MYCRIAFVILTKNTFIYINSTYSTIKLQVTKIHKRKDLFLGLKSWEVLE